MIAALSLFFSVSGFSAPLPDCFTADGSSTGKNSNGETIVDGQWIVNVNVPLITKDNLVWLLGAAHSNILEPMQYPIARPEYLFLFIQAKDDWAHYPRPSPREEIMAKANAEMSKIAALEGVEGVGCNLVNFPTQPNN